VFLVGTFLGPTDEPKWILIVRRIREVPKPKGGPPKGRKAKLASPKGQQKVDIKKVYSNSNHKPPSNNFKFFPNNFDLWAFFYR